MRLALLLSCAVGVSLAEDICYMLGGVSIAFKYSTTEDSSLWFTNYKGYGKFQSNNYIRKRTTIYNSAGRPRVVINQQRRRMPFIQSVLNAPPVMQQQQQSIEIPNFIQSNTVPEADVPTTPPTPTTSTTPKPPPLPIWKLTIPRNIKSLSAVLLSEDGSTSPAFEFSDEELTTASNITQYDTGYEKILDVTDQAIQTDGLYLICVVRSVSLNGVSTDCRKCKVVRACSSSYKCHADVVRGMTEIMRFSSQTKTTMRYQIGELPGTDAVLSSKLYFSPQYRRCSREFHDEPLQTIETPIASNQIAFVTIPGLKKRKGFRVEATLSMNIAGEKVEMDVDSPESINFCSNRAKTSNLVEIPDDDEYS